MHLCESGNSHMSHSRSGNRAITSLFWICLVTKVPNSQVLHSSTAIPYTLWSSPSSLSECRCSRRGAAAACTCHHALFWLIPPVLAGHTAEWYPGDRRNTFSDLFDDSVQKLELKNLVMKWKLWSQYCYLLISCLYRNHCIIFLLYSMKFDM